MPQRKLEAGSGRAWLGRGSVVISAGMFFVSKGGSMMTTRQRERAAVLGSADPDPTLEEIRQRCFEIQAFWDQRTELLRRGLDEERIWSVPAYRTEKTPEGLAVVREDCA